MRALSIRQPFAELILRGIKTTEFRSRPTRLIAQRFYIYASRTKARVAVWSQDLRVARPPQWMIELAEQVGMIEPGAVEALPTGVIAGSAVLAKVSQVDSMYRWHLVDVQRARKLCKPGGIRSRCGSSRFKAVRPPANRINLSFPAVEHILVEAFPEALCQPPCKLRPHPSKTRCNPS